MQYGGLAHIFLPRFWGADHSPPFIFIVIAREKSLFDQKKLAGQPKDKPFGRFGFFIYKGR
jgi:hypothetical protein